MKVVIKILKVLGSIILFILVLALYVFLTQRYQFRVKPEKELAAYSGQNIDYPMVDNQFSIPTDGPSNFKVISQPMSDPEAILDSRQVISLNGIWEIEEGAYKKMPGKFEHTCIVPGLVDLATPAFEAPGEVKPLYSLKALKPSNLLGLVRFKDKNREAFWYRRSFTLNEDQLGELVMLKVHRAKYTSTVWINGEKAGENGRLYSPGIYNISRFLKAPGEENEIIIRVASDIRYKHTSNIYGDVLEKKRHIPGIYDKVELITSGNLHIEKVQIVPNINDSTVRVLAWVKNNGTQPKASHLDFVVNDSQNQYLITDLVTTINEIHLEPGEEDIVDVIIPMDTFSLWSPENPNLYTLQVNTSEDVYKASFGMREFYFDPDTNVPILNGSPYYLRGTSVPFFRFAEDPMREHLAWDEQWIRELFRTFKRMNWNHIRFHVGPAPSLWYQIADEEGMLIQDEYAIWTMKIFRLGLPIDTVVSEYVHWMEEQWNHASLLIWDAQNESTETSEPRTGYAIKMVRGLDLSNRPWDNGWGNPVEATDMVEQHPYLFFDGMAAVYGRKVGPLYQMEELNTLNPDTTNFGENGHAAMVNEYAWLWVRRDGEPTSLTRGGYQKYFPHWGKEERFEYYARNLAALTELYRSQRPAGVMQFAGLSSNFPGCGTTDLFLDPESLHIEENLEKYLPDAFSPLGLCIYNWSDTIDSGSSLEVPITLINDLDLDWNGTIDLEINNTNGIHWQSNVSAGVPKFGKKVFPTTINYPEEPDWYELIASVVDHSGNTVKSRRKFYIK
jgi:beta-galactosidase